MRRLPSGWRKFGWQWLRRGLRGVAVLAAVYAGYLLVGLVPLNRGYTPLADGVDAVDIYVWSSAVHADLVVPIRGGGIDWREWFPDSHFRGDTDWATHVAIGWGDRGFYIETPTWNDLKATTALNALMLPSDSVVHVAFTSAPPEASAAQRARLSDEQYRRLCESIQTAFAVSEAGLPRQITGEAYHDYDAFYRGRGVYHCFNTCNSWVGRKLHAAGLPTPLFTPLPGSPTLYLPAVP